MKNLINKEQKCIALERNFTRGRRKDQVEAACLYIACRENKKPYLLIEFSEHLRINVYVLGAVFLQLCKLLSLQEHPIVQKPVDPSLFIHRFTDRLFNGKKPSVSRTALQIIASMKRDWMQTGRKPSGLCGAALYISALSHGFRCSKSEIIKVVHICEATLTKRLIEFENTESGCLTIEEFSMKAEELEKEERLNKSLDNGLKSSGINELLCEHKGSKKPPFAHGLCESCYTDFMKLSGGLDGGSEPPAFQRAERERLMAKEAADESTENMDSTILPCPAESKKNATLPQKHVHDYGNDSLQGADVSFEESENFSDIDDIEEQAAKEAAKKAFELNFDNCSEDVQAAQKLAAAAAAAVAKSRKERQQKRAADIKSSGPPQTAAEAARQMLDRKRLSSKINYDVLDKLFDEPGVSDNSKKTRVEPELYGEDDDYVKHSKDDLEAENAHYHYYENEEDFDYER
ncbi:transcription factor IIIB 60 kDa subunit [Dorcoceras hygrometricum]|nr:transcription factor IIIB 60 kDa subunit [Dorcoceras hygrometricum]